MAKTVSTFVLRRAAEQFFGTDISTVPLATLECLITISQYCTDLALKEIEDRGELTFYEDLPIVPYYGEEVVETILRR